MMENLHFLRPEWLWAFLCLLFLPLIILKRRKTKNAWDKVCDPKLLRYLLISTEPSRFFIPVFLLGLGWTIAIIALAGPSWEKIKRPTIKEPENTVFLLDISLAMNVKDITPSRMKRGVFKVSDLLKKTSGGQNALVLYDSIPFVAVPLTQDASVIENVLPTVQAGMMGGHKPDLGSALQQARSILNNVETKNGNVYVIGSFADESILGSAMTEAKKLREDGHRLSIIGIGTKQGGPMLLPDGSFVKSPDNKTIIASLTQDAFRDLASQGGGSYATITAGDEDINAVYEKPVINTIDFDKLIKEKTIDEWKDEGALLTWFLIPLMLFAFRRGWLAVFFFSFLLNSTDAYAWSLRDLWTRKDRQAAENIINGQKSNPDVFKDPHWKAVAAYRLENYQKTIDNLKNIPDLEAQYNYGNALAHIGQYQQAINVYEKILKENPEHTDAAFNKKYLEDQLKQQEQSSQSNQNPQSQSNQQQNKQNSDNSNQNNQNSPKNDSKNNQDNNQNNNQNENNTNKPNDSKNDSENQKGNNNSDSAPPSQDEKEENNQGSAGSSPENNEEDPEQKRRNEWLRKVPDNPSGLLYERIRRKLAEKQRR